MSRNDTDFKKDKAILALLSHSTIEAAAQDVGVTRKTLHRWLKEEDFKEKLEEAKRETVGLLTIRVRASMQEALNTLTEVMGDREMPAHARVSAAKAVLDAGFKAIEQEDILVRLDKLEAGSQ
jgi:transposase-like protein